MDIAQLQSQYNSQKYNKIIWPDNYFDEYALYKAITGFKWNSMCVNYLYQNRNGQIQGFASAFDRIWKINYIPNDTITLTYFDHSYTTKCELTVITVNRLLQICRPDIYNINLKTRMPCDTTCNFNLTAYILFRMFREGILISEKTYKGETLSKVNFGDKIFNIIENPGSSLYINRINYLCQTRALLYWIKRRVNNLQSLKILLIRYIQTNKIDFENANIPIDLKDTINIL
uniref:Uncharacterized protein n=1 Tax=Marseillevirus LCMAC102 TaxID=2506603 RepID=A0A481YT97_9VIRU|nr:MAG: hypothetical protein LCMAC102_01040 [Marseillevirus LCMAC102]